MKKRLDISKDELWGKIVQDDRMPKEKSRNNYGVLSLLLLSAILMVALVFKYSDFSNDYAITADAYKVDENIVSRKESLIQRETRSEHSSNRLRDSGGNTEKDSSIQHIPRVNSTVLKTSAEDRLNNSKSISTSDNRNRDFHQNGKPNFSLKVDQVTLSSTSDERAIETRGNTPKSYRENKNFGLLDPNRSSVKDLNDVKSIIEMQIENSPTGEDNNSENRHSLNVDNDPIEVNNETKRVALAALPNDQKINLLNISVPDISLAEPVFHPIKPVQNNTLNIYTNIRYGLSFGRLKDGLNMELNDNRQIQRRMNAYQAELGVSKLIGSWRVQAGLGADIIEGRAQWSQVDTIYRRLDTRSTYERTEEITTRTRYQRFGNVYATANLGYQLNMSKWSITLYAGLRYNLINLSGGTIVNTESLEETPITGSESRDRYAMTLGFDLQRQIVSNFSVSLGAKYESAINYRFNNGLQQSITPVYISLGTQFRF